MVSESELKKKKSELCSSCGLLLLAILAFSATIVGSKLFFMKAEKFEEKENAIQVDDTSCDQCENVGVLDPKEKQELCAPIKIACDEKESFRKKKQRSQSDGILFTVFVICFVDFPAFLVVLPYFSRSYTDYKKAKKSYDEEHAPQKTIDLERKVEEASAPLPPALKIDISEPTIDREISITSTAAKKCVVCCANEISMLVLPCSHLCLCPQCSAKIGQKCPVCRGNISGAMKVYT